MSTSWYYSNSFLEWMDIGFELKFKCGPANKSTIRLVRWKHTLKLHQMFILLSPLMHAWGAEGSTSTHRFIARLEAWFTNTH